VSSISVRVVFEAIAGNKEMIQRYCDPARCRGGDGFASS
jgi:hypothetical protein